MRGDKAIVAVAATLMGLFAALVSLGANPPVAQAESPLKGTLLVAAPEMTDPNFERTVIFLIYHDREGSIGVVINVPIAEVPLTEMLQQISPADGDDPDQPAEAAPEADPSDLESQKITVHYGGPVQPTALGLLHSSDVVIENSQRVSEDFVFTRDPEILNLMVEGKGPEKSIFTLGYAGWAPEQLETELKRGSWYVIAAGEALVFGEDPKVKWDEGIARGAPEL